jgi:hypothetical protein
MTEKEINEQFTAKIRRGIFKPVARHITNMAGAVQRRAPSPFCLIDRPQPSKIIRNMIRQPRLLFLWNG